MPLGTSALKKVTAWYLLHKAKILVFRVSHPKDQWGLDVWGTLLVGPRPSCIDPMLPPLGSHLILEGTRIKHPKTLMGWDILQYQEQG